MKTVFYPFFDITEFGKSDAENMSILRFFTPQDINEARLTGGPLARRQKSALDKTIPATMAKTVETGRLDAFRLDWMPGQPRHISMLLISAVLSSITVSALMK